MKTKKLILIALLTFSLKPMALRAQGSLTPPGPPGPTMVTLSQIEPRTPISAAPYTITNPGSYYLTTNLTVTTGNVITIAASGVTLDLNGFTISSTDPTDSSIGIFIYGGLQNLTIANGFIQGAVTNNGSGVYGGGGFIAGITSQFFAPASVNVLVSRVSVSGCLDYGILLGSGDSIAAESCTMRTIGDYGIVASTIKSCSAIDCGGAAISGDQVSDCRGQSTGSSDGISANYTAQNCYGTSISGDGLYAGETAENCCGQSSSSYGLNAGETAENCYGTSSSWTGLGTTTAQNCVGSGSLDGIDAYVALNCYGNSSGNNYGIDAQFSASGCFGYSSYGTGLYAYIANACHGANSSGPSISTAHNVNSY